MAWVKVPPEHHPLFLAALPKDKRVQTMPMFGGVAAKVNGHIFGGLFGRSAIVRVSDADRAKVLALDGAQVFDPMGNGKGSKTSLQLPESMMDEPDELRAWLRRAFDHAVTLPPKKPKPAAKKKPATPRASSRKPPSRSRRRSA
jgi:TfoX/Sxy family transcriptional regulator of competence genes